MTNAGSMTISPRQVVTNAIDRCPAAGCGLRSSLSQLACGICRHWQPQPRRLREVGSGFAVAGLQDLAAILAGLEQPDFPFSGSSLC